MGSKLYPNLYVILVAPPGIGKSKITSRVEEIWRAQPNHRTAPSSLSKAGLVDALDDAKRTVQRLGEIPSSVTFNSLKILSNELAVLLPSYDTAFMATLTDIYDGTPFAERIRSRAEDVDIPRPQINLLAGTTPSQLNGLLPQGAWDQGFLSRSLLVYSGEKILSPLFNVAGGDEDGWKAIRDDAKQIGNLYGEVKFSEEAAEAIEAWHLAGGPPIPEHPKLQHYNVRRTMHLLKLCLVCSVSAGNGFVVELDHYQRALSYLVEAETYMPDIFKSMATGGDAQAMEECWYFVYQYNAKNQKPVPESMVYAFLQERVPAHSVEQMVKIMTKSGHLQQKTVNKVGTCYQARAMH